MSKRHQNFALLGIFVAILTGISLLFAPYFYNNWKVHQFLTSLEQIKLPADSEIIASDSNFGILWGVGNHCDVEVYLLVKSTIEGGDFFTELIMGNKETLLSYPYTKPEDLNLDAFYVENGSVVTLGLNEVSEWEDSRTESRILDFYEQNMPNQENENAHYYIIGSWDQAYSGYAMNDLRCN